MGGADASPSFCFVIFIPSYKALAVAKFRESKNLPPLHTFLIDVISSTSASLDHADMEWLKQHKLSSTFIRQWVIDKEVQIQNSRKAEDSQEYKNIKL